MMRAEERLLEAMDRIYTCIPRIVEVQKKRVKENLFDKNKCMVSTNLIIEETSLGTMLGYVNNEHSRKAALNSLGNFSQ